MKQGQSPSEKASSPEDSNKMHELEVAIEKLKSIEKEIKFLEERR